MCNNNKMGENFEMGSDGSIKQAADCDTERCLMNQKFQQCKWNFKEWQIVKGPCLNTYLRNK